MVKSPQIEDLVYVSSQMPGGPKTGTGVIKASSTGEEGAKYLIEFEGSQTGWYNETSIKEVLQRDSEAKLTVAPKRSTWSQNPELRESILDAWYELSPETFTEALELFEEYGAAMLEWLRDSNPELFERSRIEGHKLLGITIYYKGSKK